MTNMNSIYGGVSGVELADNEFDFGDGIIIRKTYAHLTAPFIMAFKPPGKYKHHEGPWKAAKGGISFDISVEIEVPASPDKEFEQHEVMWTVVSLLRLVAYPYMCIPAISNISFSDIVSSDKDPIIQPYETRHRYFGPPGEVAPVLGLENLEWVKDRLESTITLMKREPKFYSAFKAFDSATEINKISLSLLTLWGAIEQLFSPNTGELKYRVSANLASFLVDHGEERLKLFKEISKLYNDRSTAAHTSKDMDYPPLVATWVHLRNAMIKIVDQGRVPSQDDLEKLIFTV